MHFFLNGLKNSVTADCWCRQRYFGYIRLVFHQVLWRRSALFNSL